MDSEIRRIAEEVRRNLISEIQDSDETAENKKAIITFVPPFHPPLRNFILNN